MSSVRGCSVVLVLLLAVVAVSGEVFMKEDFSAGWESRWEPSASMAATGKAGRWKWTTGKWYGNDQDMGIQTAEDSRHYLMTGKFTKPFTNRDRDLVFQYQVKNEQFVDCAGFYLKMLRDTDLKDQAVFDRDTPYAIMFGGDMCGQQVRKIHMIFNYGGRNVDWKKTPRCEADRLSHVYTMVLHPDSTYEVYVDLEKIESGFLEEDWNLLRPKMILDMDAVKPADWDDREFIELDSTKPEGWDDIPEMIPDPDDKMPEDWNVEEDGEYVVAMIPNPEYKGEWTPEIIPNPNYKGPWRRPMKPNPAYASDDEAYVYEGLNYVAFDLWQVKSGTLFDNIFVGDDFEEAKAFALETWGATKDSEHQMYDDLEAERQRKEAEVARAREEDRRRAEEQRKKDALARVLSEDSEDEDDWDMPVVWPEGLIDPSLDDEDDFEF